MISTLTMRLPPHGSDDCCSDVQSVIAWAWNPGSEWRPAGPLADLPAPHQRGIPLAVMRLPGICGSPVQVAQNVEPAPCELAFQQPGSWPMPLGLIAVAFVMAMAWLSGILAPMRLSRIQCDQI